MTGRASPVLTADVAVRLADAALAAAAGSGRHVAAVIVDSGGHDLVVHRDHEAFPSAVPIARAKAFTAVNFGRPTHEMAEQLGSIEYALQIAQADPRLAFLKGGLPVVVDDVVVGAIGVSGASADDDLAFARRALDALG